MPAEKEAAFLDNDLTGLLVDNTECLSEEVDVVGNEGD